MSVILEDDQKFQDIFGALLARNGREDVRWFFSYRGDDTLPIEANVGLFVGRLHLGNVASYNERYSNEDEKPRPIDLNNGGAAGSRWTDLELIKALKSMNYQNAEGEDIPEHKKTGERLRELIYALMSSVIDKIPGYDQARTW